MIRLGLFGGTFDPVHYGHLRTVSRAREELGLPSVTLLPNPRPPHKLKVALTPYVHRKAMLQLAVREFPDLTVADFEEQAIGPAYTTDTVKRVIASLPDGPRELWLIIGADSMLELPQWRDPEELFRHANVAVLPRPGFPLEEVDPQYLARVKVLKTPLEDISATEIRRRLQQGESVAGLVPPAVQAYILAHGLYGVAR